MLSTSRILIIIYIQMILTFISLAQISHLNSKGIQFHIKIHRWVKNEPRLTPSLFDLLNFLSQQMASSSLIHLRNLEVNHNSMSSIKSHSITKSYWVYQCKYILKSFHGSFQLPIIAFLFKALCSGLN